MNDHEGDAPASADGPQTNPSQSESAGEDQPKKKRRRRRRRKKTSGEGTETTATTNAESSGEPASDHGDRPRKRRGGGRGRGRDGGGRGRGRGRDDGPPPDDGPDPLQQSRQRTIISRDDVENWEEIFEGTFEDLELNEDVLAGLKDVGFVSPTKIQAQLIPLVLDGRDVLGQSRTGTGKTAAFGIPALNMAEKGTEFGTIILAPTRELAIQIGQELIELGKHTGLRVAAVYGGQRIDTQAKRLADGPEIIVATPGRLLDMRERGYLHFNNARYAVLDEMDRMLDIGFRDDIRKILGMFPKDAQLVFVSATIEDEIERLARKHMRDPEKLVTSTGSLTVSLVDQHYISVKPWDKKRLLAHLLTHEEPELTLVFCRMKRTVDGLVKYLSGKGIESNAIHGDMYQGKRNRVIQRLRDGQLSVLICSDLAARGLDVDNISHVINYDLPEDPEVYIHRIGRTARAGRRGEAWSFVTPEQGELLTAIEHLANAHIPEQTYPDFVPGDPPSDIRQEQAAEQKRLEQLKSQPSRFSKPDAPNADKGDASKFPGGVVPAKMPPKRIGGRVRTGRG
ncbi:MAG: DEAD/DEAH box helicase [Planctomycetota bacterium]